MNFLINAAWQVLLIAVAGWACERIAKRVQAKYQHCVWVAVLVLCIGVPALSDTRGSRPGGSAAPMSFESGVTADRGALPASNLVTQAPASGTEHAIASGSWSQALRPQEHRIPLRTGLVYLLAACYVLWLIHRLIRFSLACKVVRELRQSSVASDLSEEIESAAERCRSEIGLASLPILWSRLVHSPATLGIGRPIVILPASILEATDAAMLTSVIGHEMAHIKRRDFALNLVCELLCLPISFHPAAALVKRRIAGTRELACDEMVTERLFNPSEYARALVTAASRVAGVSRESYTLGVFDAGNLEERIMKLTNQKSRMNARAGRAILIALAFLLLATGAVASAYSFNAGPVFAKGQKQDKQPGRGAGFLQVMTKDGTVLVAPQREVPDELKPLLGTWKGSYEYDIPRIAELTAGRDPIKHPWNKHMHSDTQIDFAFEGGKLVGNYMIYQRVTKTDGQQTFEIHQSEFVDPRFDGVTVSTATADQQRENEEDQEQKGQSGERYFKVRLTGDGVAEAWNGVGNWEAKPHLVLRKQKLSYEPRRDSSEERRR